MSALDQFGHVTEEEREQQRTNVRTIHVGIRHEDDFCVTQLRRIEVIFADAASECGDHGPDFLVPEHLVVSRLLHVENLALKRQDCLEAAVAALLGCSARRLTFDQVDLATVSITLGTIGELAWEAGQLRVPGRLQWLC